MEDWLPSWLYEMFNPAFSLTVAVVILVVSILRRAKPLLYVSLGYFFLCLVLTVDFVRGYGSVARANNHGWVLGGIILGALPLIGYGVGRALSRIRS